MFKSQLILVAAAESTAAAAAAQQQQQPQKEYFQLRGAGGLHHNENDAVTTTTTSTTTTTNSTTFTKTTLLVPLHAKSGTHHVVVYVGEPPRPRVLIVDTGSRLTAWTCHPCKNCGGAVPDREMLKDGFHHELTDELTHRPLYDPQESSTVQIIPCGQCEFKDDSTCAIQQEEEESSSSYMKNKTNVAGFARTTFTKKLKRQTDSPHEQCVLRQRYTEGSSWTAYEVNDIVSLSTTPPDNADTDTNADATTLRMEQDYEQSLMTPHQTAFALTFGCQTTLTGLFRKQYADGILGLERYHHYVNDRKNENPSLFIKSLMHSGVIDNTSFSLCMSEKAGWMGLGGPARQLHTEPMQLTPLQKDQTTKTGLYAVSVQEAWLGDVCLTCHPNKAIAKQLVQSFHNGKGTILDSGTTDTYLPAAIGKPFAQAWNDLTGNPLVLPESRTPTVFSYTELLALPAVRLVFANNVTLHVPALHYMEGALEFQAYMEEEEEKEKTIDPTATTDNKKKKKKKKNPDTTKRVLKNRMYTDEPTGAVLGINSMMGYDIFFDSQNSQIGFAKANCG